MANKALRAKALTLRSEGKSYSEIKNLLGTPKGTLSYWLKDMPLSQERILELGPKSERRIERYRETRRKQKEARLATARALTKKTLFPFSKRDILVAGYFLYWGEGSKSNPAEVGIANTDPAVIKMFIEWMETCFSVPKEKMLVRVHLYSDMNEEEELRYWQKITGVSRKNFKKSYIKESTRAGLSYKGLYGHGTCNIRINNVLLRNRIIEGIKLLQEKFGMSGA